jgi:Ca2+-binding EF-hand superfamily protein
MKKVIPLAIVTVAIFSNAFAQVAPGMPSDDSTSPAKATFEALDANKDGVISVPEAKASVTVTTAFATADKNGDGMLSRSEFDAYFNKF